MYLYSDTKSSFSILNVIGLMANPSLCSVHVNTWGMILRGECLNLINNHPNQLWIAACLSGHRISNVNSFAACCDDLLSILSITLRTYETGYGRHGLLSLYHHSIRSLLSLTLYSFSPFLCHSYSIASKSINLNLEYIYWPNIRSQLGRTF